eukprot:698727-Rhodomonas_salina.1
MSFRCASCFCATVISYNGCWSAPCANGPRRLLWGAAVRFARGRMTWDAHGIDRRTFFEHAELGRLSCDFTHSEKKSLVRDGLRPAQSGGSVRCCGLSFVDAAGGRRRKRWRRCRRCSPTPTACSRTAATC